MEIGLGIDQRFALSKDDQRALAEEAAELGYGSLWTPIANTREPFDNCAIWSRAAGLETGIAVAPLSAWSLDTLASVAKETEQRTGGRFTLGIGSGRVTEAPVRRMRDAVDLLRPRLPGMRIYLGALGPQMLRLAGDRYDGAALNWCTAEHVRWCRSQVDRGGRAVTIHEYIRVCVDEDENAARLAFAKMTLSYALAREGGDKTKGYRAHFARMGFDEALSELEVKRERGATEDELARSFPVALLERVGYFGSPTGARAAFRRLAEGLDIAVVRPVPARRNDAEAVRLAMRACAPRS